MKIEIIEPISLCYGVECSIKMIKEAKTTYADKLIFCMGHPVHNEKISQEISDLGIQIIDASPEKYQEEIEKLPDDSVVIFSAHGHDNSLNKLCERKNLNIIDTVCPIVKAINEQINSLVNKENKQVIYIGKKNHAESYAIVKNNPKVDFWEFSSSFSVDFQYNSPYIFNQTTILEDKLEKIYHSILADSPGAIIKNTSCKFVYVRYSKMKELNSSLYDYILVIGSNTSSNSVELYEKAIEYHGKEKALLISKAEDLKFMFDLKVKPQSVAVFSGTSTPQSLINEIIETLRLL